MEVPLEIENSPTISLHLHPIPKVHIKAKLFYVLFYKKKSIQHRGACRMGVERTGKQSRKKGEGGIRTLGDCEATLVFKTNALNRSATSPWYAITFLNNNKVVLINTFSGYLIWGAVHRFCFLHPKGIEDNDELGCILCRTSVGPFFSFRLHTVSLL